MKKEQQPAFPSHNIKKYPDRAANLTTRQYYAAKAVQALIVRRDWTPSLLAPEAFELADALIAFEEKEGKE